MKNGDIAELPPVEQCSRRQRHAAAGDGRLSSASPVTEYADVAFKAELAPKFSYGCAVFLDTDRVNFQKEGFSKEELLAGLAQVLPKNVWQYVVQIPRLAALGTQVRAPGRHAVQPRRRQGAGRLHQGARPGRRGLRPPAHRRGRRDRRRDGDAPRRQAQAARRRSSASMQAIDLEYTTKNDEETRLPLLPEQVQAHVHRHEDAPTARPAATSPASPARRAPSRARRRCSTLVAERKKIAQAVPEPRRLRGEARVHALLRARADARATARRSRTSWSRRASSAQRRVDDHAARSSARSDGVVGEAPRASRIGIPRVLNIYSTAPFFRTYFEALGIPKQNVVFSDETTEEMWVEGGKYGSIDPCYPSQGRAGAHPQPALPPAHRRRSRSSTSSSRSSRTCRRFVANTMDNGELPDRRRRARGHEGGLHEGGRLLRRRAASSTSTRRSPSSSRTSWRSRMFETLGPAPRHHRGRERLSPAARRWKALDSLRGRPAGEGPRDPRDGRGARTASRS